MKAEPAPAKKAPVVLDIRKGSKLSSGGREYVVLRLVDLNLVLARESASGEPVLLRLGVFGPHVEPSAETPPPSDIDLEAVPAEDWEEAEHRLSLIEPLMASPVRRTRSDYADVARAASVSTATVYRWVSTFRGSGLLSSLLPLRRSGGRRKSRLNPEVQLIADNYILTQHLTQQKPTVAHSAREIRRLCSNAGLSPLPAHTTIQRHIEWIDGKVRYEKREGTKAAREKFAIHESPIPDAEWPLAMVQIDHTLLPVIVVDDKHRKPINRAWITLAIDCFSRVCVGMYLSLDSPSAMSAGMCISHAILPKEDWLSRMGCADIEWPYYGAMEILHMDNAKEFRGNMLRLASGEYRIDLHLRRCGVPHYGAYIERLMGTVSQDLKALKGATFSGPAEKGVYDAEGNACMTLDELEKWLVLMFVRYHASIHRGIGTTPHAKWREGILGTKFKPGRGIPPRRTDTEKVRIDFMPFEERTIQDYGVVIDEVEYFHDVLRPWVGLRDPENPRLSRTYRFRYDPRDISQLYFFEPEVRRYFAIPYRDASHPPASIWELREARKKAVEIGMSTRDERAIFALITRQREIEESAAANTKSARRAQQKLAQHKKARDQKKHDLPTVSNPSQTVSPDAIRGYDPNKITPIDDDY